MSSNDWFCVECNHVLGHVVGREFTPAETVPHSNIHTRGVDLSVTCPQCSKVKIWYTSDPINRALNQLIDAITSALVMRLMPQLSDATMKLRKNVQEIPDS